MKKKIICVLLICLLFTTGCNLNEEFIDKNLYTTIYPIEYATNILYSDYAKISSVYPDNADNEYVVTDKKKNIYSTGEIFIYSGIAKEAYLARDLININGNLKLIDATKGMDDNSSITNMWLDPSNYLMLCSNIKTGLIEYSDNIYVKENIEEKYKSLNEKVSELDVQLYDIGKNGNYNTILTTNNVFNYLKKYNIDVISLDEENQALNKSYSDAKNLINSKKIQYVFLMDGDILTDTQEKFISDNSLVKIKINDLYTLSDSERKNNKNYITLMNEIIDKYKKELYK